MTLSQYASSPGAYLTQMKLISHIFVKLTESAKQFTINNNFILKSTRLGTANLSSFWTSSTTNNMDRTERLFLPWKSFFLPHLVLHLKIEITMLQTRCTKIIPVSETRILCLKGCCAKIHKTWTKRLYTLGTVSRKFR